MFDKIKSNYKLCNILVRIAYVITFVFCSWQSSLATATALLSVYDAPFADFPLLVALLTSAVLGVAFMFLTPPLVRVFLNAARIYSVPVSEYCLLANCFFVLGFFVTGLLNLINLATPLFLIWGRILFPFIALVGCMIGFYAVTAKRYFNDVTKVYYFRSMLVAFAVLLIVVEVL